MRTELRKHVTQMSAVEKKFVHCRIRTKRAEVSIDNVNIGYHANEMMKTRPRFDINLPIIIDTIKHSMFYEYKIIKEGDKIVDERVLLRSKKAHKGSNVIIVYSLMWNKVITVWCNSKDDNHSALDYSLYNKDMKIVGVVN